MDHGTFDDRPVVERTKVRWLPGIRSPAGQQQRGIVVERDIIVCKSSNKHSVYKRNQDPSLHFDPFRG